MADFDAVRAYARTVAAIGVAARVPFVNMVLGITHTIQLDQPQTAGSAPGDDVVFGGLKPEIGHFSKISPEDPPFFC